MCFHACVSQISLSLKEQNKLGTVGAWVGKYSFVCILVSPKITSENKSFENQSKKL